MKIIGRIFLIFIALAIFYILLYEGCFYYERNRALDNIYSSREFHSPNFNLDNQTFKFIKVKFKYNENFLVLKKENKKFLTQKNNIQYLYPFEANHNTGYYQLLKLIFPEFYYTLNEKTFEISFEIYPQKKINVIGFFLFNNSNFLEMDCYDSIEFQKGDKTKKIIVEEYLSKIEDCNLNGINFMSNFKKRYCTIKIEDSMFE